MLWFFAMPCFAAYAGAAAEFYVSPTGDDGNAGTREKPFATVGRARDAMRKVEKGRQATVYLREGTYYLPETLVFLPEDSGSQEAPVVYAAYKDEKPVLSGGRLLSLQWQPYERGILKASVPRGLTFDQLFVNGRRQPMARYPNFDAAEPHFNGYAADAFSPERVPRWKDPTGGFIHALHKGQWGGFDYRITGKDQEGNLTYEGGWQNNRQAPMHPLYRFVENIFEELDAPGEWFLDGKTVTLYFMPPQGLDPAAAKVECAGLPCLIEFRGSEARPVRHIRLDGLILTHAARTFMETKEPLLRSDWTIHRGGAVFVTGAEDVELRDLELGAPGGNSIFLSNYNRRVAIRDCYIHDSGASSVCFVGDPGAVRSPLFEYSQAQAFEDMDHEPGPRTSNYPAECVVEGCLLVRNGRFEKQSAGVEIAMSMDIVVRHNSIYETPRAGINVGDGCWGGHLVEGNDVFDTVLETSDHGSFNSWGRDRYWYPGDQSVTVQWVDEHPDMPFWDAIKPVILRNNRWRCDHGWDIDLDDGSSNYEISNNLCLSGGIKNREGYRRRNENNVLVNNGFKAHVWYPNSREDTFVRNIVFTPYQTARIEDWSGTADYNFLHAPGESGPAVSLQGVSKQDQHSVQGDAMFVDPPHGDYRVKDGSPALALGFRNFAMDRFGVESPRLRAIARTPSFGARPAEGKGKDGKRQKDQQTRRGAK